MYQEVDETDLEDFSGRDKQNIEGFKSSEEKTGRSITLDSIFATYQKNQENYPNLSEEAVKLIIERFEMIDLLESGKFKLMTIRGGSIFHSILRDKINDHEESFLCSTERAYSERKITEEEKKTLDFIWKVRTDVAHTYWTDTEYSLQYYTIAANLILVHLYIEIESRLEDKRLKKKILPTSIDESNLESPKEGLNIFINRIENELGHEYSKNESWDI